MFFGGFGQGFRRAASRVFFGGFLLLGTPAWAQNVRILLLADVHAKNVGEAIVVSAGKFVSAIETIRLDPNLKDRVTLDILGTGERPVRASDITNYYQNISIQPEDTLVFYYMGHGATDEDRGHFFAMSGGNLLRSDVLKAMQAHRPRLTVLLSDACSNMAKYRADDPDSVPYTIEEAEEMSAKVDTQVFQHLFLYQAGIVDFTAAQAPQFAWASTRTGGLFTEAFLELLMGKVEQVDVDGDGFIGWNEFNRYLRWHTNTKFQKLKQDASKRLTTNEDAIMKSERQTPDLFKFPSVILLYNDGSFDAQVLYKRGAVDGLYAVDSSQGGRRGLTIHIDATARNMKDRNFRAAVFFRYEDGEPVHSTDQVYSSVENSLVTFTTLVPKHDKSRFQDIKLFMPYHLIPKSTPGRRVGLYVQLFDVESKGSGLIGGSPFFLEEVSPQNRKYPPAPRSPDRPPAPVPSDTRPDYQPRYILSPQR